MKDKALEIANAGVDKIKEHPVIAGVAVTALALYTQRDRIRRGLEKLVDQLDPEAAGFKEQE